MWIFDKIHLGTDRGGTLTIYVYGIGRSTHQMHWLNNVQFYDIEFKLCWSCVYVFIASFWNEHIVFFLGSSKWNDFLFFSSRRPIHDLKCFFYWDRLIKAHFNFADFPLFASYIPRMYSASLQIFSVYLR